MMHLLKILIFVHFALFFAQLSAQNETKSSSVHSNMFFNNNDRLCFVGNSITHTGHFHNNIHLFFVTRMPQKHISVYNCGVAGDVLTKILQRLDTDILVNKPTKVVLMSGMNDVKRNLYAPYPISNPDTLLLRQNAIEQYKQLLDSFARCMKNRNIELVLQTPSIYDQKAALRQYNNNGANDALAICADFNRMLAAKYKLPLVDYHAFMDSLNAVVQQGNPAATIVGADRIHPDFVGHFVMFYQFIKSFETHFSSKVSDISISKNKVVRAENCKVKMIKRNAKALTFSVLEASLPFPIVENQERALSLVPFNDDFNQQLLKISGLKPGNYLLRIDGDSITHFTDKQLNAGVDIAQFKNTPQNKQALEVRKLLEQKWANDEALRAIQFLQNTGVVKKPFVENIDGVRQKLDRMIATKSASPWFIKQYQLYVDNKLREHEIKQQSDAIVQRAYVLAQTKTHIYSLGLKKNSK